MDKFYQMITELWPLIDVQNCVLLNIILTNVQILIVFCYKISGGRACCMPAALLFAYAKTKTQISFVATVKLISAFVFATKKVQSLYFLNQKFQSSSHLL